LINLTSESCSIERLAEKSYLTCTKKKILFLLDKEVDDSLFLDLIETDSLITRLTEGIKISAEDVEFATTRKCFEFVSSKIIAGHYFLLLDADWKYCGAYKHEDPPILNPTFDFNKFHSDEIRLISADFSTEITIDYSDAHNTKLFELRTCKYHPSLTIRDHLDDSATDSAKNHNADGPILPTQKNRY
jgi:hypothetical protein